MKPPPEDFRRSPADTARSLGRLCWASLTAPVQLAAHRLLWTRRTSLLDDELELPDLGRAFPGDPTTLQRADAGVGALHVRRYRLTIRTHASVTDALDVIRRDLDSLVPERFVWFRDADGGPVAGPLVEGQEFVARLTGPHDGPVRVVEVTDHSIRLATLTGHVEAGEIDFHIDRPAEDRLVVTVRSWARSGDERVRLLYERGGGARVQAYVWSQLTTQVAAALDGTPIGRIELSSRRLNWPVADRSGHVEAGAS